MARSILEDRIQGCIITSAIGDALGYPVEFHPNPVVTDLHAGSRGYAAYSDDTQMAVAVGLGLTEAGSCASEERFGRMVMRQFILWATNPPDGHRAPGGACMAGVSRLRDQHPWRTAGGSTAGGCGSVMRSHPYACAFLSRDRAVRIAVDHGHMTHRDPLADASVAALVAGVWKLVNAPVYLDAQLSFSDFLLDLIDDMCSYAGRYDRKTEGMLRWAALEKFWPLHASAKVVSEAEWDQCDKEVFDRMRGWAAHEAVCAALYAFLRSGRLGPVKALLLAASTPGDSDSIAAIAGALIGAATPDWKYRYRPEWFSILERGTLLEKLAADITDMRLGVRVRERRVTNFHKWERSRGTLEQAQAKEPSSQQHEAVPGGDVVGGSGADGEGEEGSILARPGT